MKLIQLILCLLAFAGTSLADRNGQALKALKVNDFEKAEEHLTKSLEKDPVNPGAKFFPPISRAARQS